MPPFEALMLPPIVEFIVTCLMVGYPKHGTEFVQELQALDDPAEPHVLSCNCWQKAQQDWLTSRTAGTGKLVLGGPQSSSVTQCPSSAVPVTWQQSL